MFIFSVKKTRSQIIQNLSIHVDQLLEMSKFNSCPQSRLLCINLKLFCKTSIQSEKLLNKNKTFKKKFKRFLRKIKLQKGNKSLYSNWVTHKKTKKTCNKLTA